MTRIAEKIEGILIKKPVRDIERLKKQQSYYSRLKKAGTAKQQKYDLKPISAI